MRTTHAIGIAVWTAALWNVGRQTAAGPQLQPRIRSYAVPASLSPSRDGVRPDTWTWLTEEQILVWRPEAPTDAKAVIWTPRTGDVKPLATLNALLRRERNRTHGYPTEGFSMSPDRKWVVLRLGLDSRLHAGVPKFYYWLAAVDGSSSRAYPARVNVNGRTEHAAYRACWRGDTRAWVEVEYDYTDQGLGVPGTARVHTLKPGSATDGRKIVLACLRGHPEMVAFTGRGRLVVRDNGIHDSEQELSGKFVVYDAAKTGKPENVSFRLPVKTLEWRCAASPGGSRLLWAFREAVPGASTATSSLAERVRFWLSDLSGGHFREIHLPDVAGRPTQWLSRDADPAAIFWAPGEHRFGRLVDRKLQVVPLD